MINLDVFHARTRTACSGWKLFEEKMMEIIVFYSLNFVLANFTKELCIELVICYPN